MEGENIIQLRKNRIHGAEIHRRPRYTVTVTRNTKQREKGESRHVVSVVSFHRQGVPWFRYGISTHMHGGRIGSWRRGWCSVSAFKPYWIWSSPGFLSSSVWEFSPLLLPFFALPLSCRVLRMSPNPLSDRRYTLLIFSIFILSSNRNRVRFGSSSVWSESWTLALIRPVL